MLNQSLDLTIDELHCIARRYGVEAVVSQVSESGIEERAIGEFQQKIASGFIDAFGKESPSESDSPAQEEEKCQVAINICMARAALIMLRAALKTGEQSTLARESTQEIMAAVSGASSKEPSNSASLN